MKIKVFTTFSGYDSQCLALDRLKRNNPQFDYELIGWSEIDKFAIKAHNAIYPEHEDKNYGDIATIDWHNVPDFDLLTYSSPCQDFSKAGNQKGGEKGSGTRSSLIWHIENAIRIKKPKYLLLENVSNMVSAKHIKTFNKWQLLLENIGYKNFAKVLNARNYGVAQNRDRVFLVSIRKDLNTNYYFPKPIKLDKVFEDYLEPEVDNRYFLSDKRLQTMIEKNMFSINHFKFIPKAMNDVANAITTKSGSRETDNYLLLGWTRTKDDVKFHDVSLFNSLTTRQRNNATNYVKELSGMVRTLTEKECFRMMDVDDDVIDMIQAANISKTQQIKLAGNSIVVNVLYWIFFKMFVSPKPNEYEQIEFNF